jgi:hypothetical protein
VPYVVHGDRRWFRLDLLELVVRAEVAQGRRRVRRRGAIVVRDPAGTGENRRGRYDQTHV